MNTAELDRSGTRLQVDELSFEVRRSARRKVLELVVDRGGDLVIQAPTDLDVAAMAAFVRAKRFWIYTKLAAKEAMRREVGAKELVDGEGFNYLGRSYRLLLVDAQEVPLKLTAGRFRLLRSEAARGREHFVRWYGEHAREWLGRNVAPWAARMGVDPASIAVRDLGFRWGSCSPSGGLNFHWATILLPVTVIEYVVVHELAHLAEANHTPAFWLRIERALPDYEQRKAWLAEHGGRYIALASGR